MIGYGQTENCAASCVTVPGDDAYAGHVGVPNSCLELKLVDVPEMQYLATDMPDPRGEICFRGSSVFIGYYKDPEKTKEAIDEDGWLHSGDIGKIDSRGNFTGDNSQVFFTSLTAKRTSSSSLKENTLHLIS